MIVAVFAPLYPPAFRGGGPIRSTAAMVASAPDGYTPVVLTADADLGADKPLDVPRNEWSNRAGVDIYYASVRSLSRLWKAFRAVRRRGPEMLHLNGFFNPALTILPLLLWRVGFWGRATLLIAPRGEFGDAALSRRNAKKRLYIRLFRFLRLNHFVIWHATAQHEAEDIRGLWGSEARIALRENDVLLPVEPLVPSRWPNGVARVAFVGRLVEHKGLAVALEALKSVRVGIRLDVYGSREDLAYVAMCEAIASGLSAPVEVRFRGELAPDAVRVAMAEYDAVVMPTAGENFGHVIAEALSSSCPVIATPYTPWTHVLRSAGLVVDDREPTSWAVALERFAALSASERRMMRVRAGDAYRAWRSRQTPPHVWILATSQEAQRSQPV